MNDRITIDIDAQGVATVRLSRPEKMNALDPAMFDGLREATERLKTEPKLRAVVLHGEGRAFCAGLDMANFAAMGEGKHSSDMAGFVARSHGIANAAQQVAWGWRVLPVPVIAAVHGVAFGGGLQLALGADMRFVTADLKMSVMEIKWGLVPDMAGLVTMSELARPDIVRELTFSGRIFSGEEALQMGFATRICPDPLAAALELAKQIAGSNPDAIRAGKRLLNLALTGSQGDILMAESVEQARLIGTPNQMEAARAGLERRTPVFIDTATN